MKMQLVTQSIRSDGIFSEMFVYTDEGLLHVCFTLEHAFPNPNVSGGYEPLIPRGRILTCVRKKDSIVGHVKAERFEIIGIAGHWGVLFHSGNFNEESRGCVLLGDDIQALSPGWAVTGSGDAFTRFMGLLEGLDTFELEVLQPSADVG